MTYVYFAIRLDITNTRRFAWDEMLVRPLLNTPTAIPVRRRGSPSMTSRRVTDTVVDDVASEATDCCTCGRSGGPIAEFVGPGDHGGVVSATGDVYISRSRRPIAVLAEVLVMRGISEDLAGDLASGSADGAEADRSFGFILWTGAGVTIGPPDQKAAAAPQLGGVARRQSYMQVCATFRKSETAV